LGAVDLEKQKMEIIHRIKNDPWEFCKYVFTLDEVDLKNPIKRFPWDLSYIKLYFRVLMKEKKILIPKSRRMKMTWTNCVFILWDTMFHSGRHSAVVSKKEDDADFLLQKRIKFIYENLDPEVPRELLPRLESKFGKLSFPDMNSIIQGFPQGADQLRQYTLSNLMADEFAFWDKAQETFAAAKPTLDGGGRFLGISSQAPGFFEAMVKDELEFNQLTQQRDEAGPKKVSPIQGVEIWKNKNNGFLVFQLHYSADPDKRSDEYKASIRSGMTYKDYMMEYELSWEKFMGLPVYPDFSKRIHGARERIYPWLGLPLLIGFDFGLTPAAVICQQQQETFCILKEFVAVNMGIDRFLQLIVPQIRILFPRWANFKKDFLCFMDPAGFARKDTDERTCAMALDEAGFNPSAGPISFTERKKGVEHFLISMAAGKPKLQINTQDCPVLVRGFEGGYQFAEGQDKLETREKVRPLKNEYSHPHDALQYVAAEIIKLNHKSTKTLPKLKYGFAR
jgi:hypothetical protein